MRLKHPVGEEAKRYNILQKLAYLAVVFVLLPLMVLTGLTMSPGVDAALPGLLTLFGGRQSARTIHFITANLIVLFVVVHVVEVFLAGVINEIGSMITGRYTIKTEAPSMSGLALSRRGLIAAGAAGMGGLLLTGCDRLSSAPAFVDFLGSAEGLTERTQRLLLSAQPLAREFSARDISPVFKANGNHRRPTTTTTRPWPQTGFKDWRLAVDGLVARPLSLSLTQLQALAARTQITRHDCVEGWSAIGQWTGVPLGAVLRLAGLSPAARYIVFHCADALEQSLDGTGQYYESIDLFDAFHPQTILAYAMNGQPLDIAHGAPLRLRVERQLGYKHAKYVMRIEVTNRLDHIGRGKGGFWEDRGYEWYAVI